MGGLIALLDPIGKIIDKVLPDKAANDAAKAALIQMQVKGELDASLEQVQVDIEEAKNQSVFVAGWRPFVGWVCGAAFAYAFILQPFSVFVALLFHAKFDPATLPKLDLNTMMPVLLGMLGLAAARTVEKVQGVNSGQ
jgi:Holin of 3TMs, for gene-transfer release